MPTEFVDPDVKRRLRELRQIGPHMGFIEATKMVEAGLRYIKEVRDRQQARWWTMELFERVDILDGHLQIVATGRSPEQWSEKLTAAGAPVSPETIRELALASNDFYRIGEQMILLPAQLSRLFHSSRSEAIAKIRLPRESKVYLRLVARLTGLKKRRLPKKRKT